MPLDLCPAEAVVLPLRVRYAETDQMRMAYYGRYFEWFEAARSEFCRVRGIDYTAMEEAGLFLPVAEARCRYKAPARYDDELSIAIHVAERTKRTIRFAYRVTRDGTLVAEGETTQVLVSADGRPRAFPPDIAARFDGLACCDPEPIASSDAGS